MLIIFMDDYSQSSGINARELKAIEEAARLFGCRVFRIPPNFDICETAENALAYVPKFDEPTLAVWAGFIPSIERYQAIYDAAHAKNIYLINTPAEHRLAMEFDQFYPLLQPLTPQSWIINSLADLEKLANTLPFPLFVKGAVKSNKSKGLSAVLAKNMEELKTLIENHLAQPHHSRGKVIV